MQADFWHEKWQKQEIGFHKTEINPLLQKYWSALDIATPAHILVPLCGKTLDIVWLRQQGYQVTGIELSEIALDALAHELNTQLGLAMVKQRNDDPANGYYRLDYQGEGVHLIGGDFFSTTAEEIGPVSAVYDRAALVALPKELRSPYTQHLRKISNDAAQLLITLDYEQAQMAGPPFAINEAEVFEHYTKTFECKRLHREELIHEEPRFQALGLQSFRQQVYLLSPRARVTRS
ncbi:Thiopurine S-methyltransferase [gamma proteobacterium HdN1]|nr:Thiopurine S-methyltransferase [gamma proteobacterium HdN1]